ncbi:hypothetical protein [Brooklawnia sp.]|uniref:hypothetical protein n=1 Tax=Brooklawnia sp. TaxID=2699740 RepID=UPI00311D3AF5
MKNRRLIVLIAPVALVLGLIQAPAAFASPDDVVQAANRMDTAIGRANPDVSQEVVDGLPISIQIAQTFGSIPVFQQTQSG